MISILGAHSISVSELKKLFILLKNQILIIQKKKIVEVTFILARYKLFKNISKENKLLFIYYSSNSKYDYFTKWWTTLFF